MDIILPSRDWPFKNKPAILVKCVELCMGSREKRKKDESSLELRGLRRHPEGGELRGERRVLRKKPLVNKMDCFLLYFPGVCRWGGSTKKDLHIMCLAPGKVLQKFSQMDSTKLHLPFYSPRKALGSLINVVFGLPASTPLVFGYMRKHGNKNWCPWSGV